MNTWETAVAQINAFAETLERVIDEDSRRLAAKIAGPNRSVERIGWSEDRHGWQTITISLSDGTGVSATGGGKLEALAELERKVESR